MEPESQCVCESGGTGRSKKKFRQKKKQKKSNRISKANNMYTLKYLD